METGFFPRRENINHENLGSSWVTDNYINYMSVQLNHKLMSITKPVHRKNKKKNLTLVKWKLNLDIIPTYHIPVYNNNFRKLKIV